MNRKPNKLALQRSIRADTAKIGHILKAYPEGEEIPPDADRVLWDLFKARAEAERTLIALLR
jgi:hypothetical protein